MIVSHEHEFIFIKTRKTAGTSIEVFLGPLAGETAIVTRNLEERGVVHRARNYTRRFNPLPELAREIVGGGSGVRRTIKDFRHRRAFYGHMPGALVRDRIGRKTWNSYFKFSVERNPWDKAVSRYFWALRRESWPDLEAFILGCNRSLLSQWELYAKNDRLCVDFMVRFEHLEEDLRKVLDQVGLDDKVVLPRMKATFRPAGARLEFSDRANQRIRSVCAREIELFGYREPEWMS